MMLLSIQHHSKTAMCNDFPLNDGGVSTHMFAGKHTGHVSPLPDGGLLMQLKWEGNFGGHGEDRFQLEGPMLVVRSMLVMNGITVRYVQSYRRKE